VLRVGESLRRAGGRGGPQDLPAGEAIASNGRRFTIRGQTSENSGGITTKLVFVPFEARISKQANSGNPSMQSMPHGRASGDSPKVRATLYLSAEVLNEARNAAVHLAGYPARLTLTKLAESALRNELARLKDRYNNGQDFPERGEDLKGGRPIAA
jgi:hypothetical protein